MLNSVIDGTILNDFFNNRPDPVPIGSAEQNDIWISFYRFVKSNANICIFNVDCIENVNEIFLTSLTTGRGDAKIVIDDSFSLQDYVNQEDSKFSLLFISENAAILNNRNVFIANKENYLNKWEKLSLFSLHNVLDVRQSATIHKFTKWLDIRNYLQVSNDIVLFDRYIAEDISLLNSNLFKLIDEFEEINKTNYSLVIISISDRNPLNNKRIYNEIETYISENKYKCNLGYVFLPLQQKQVGKVLEHDRTIITNFIRINSGNSFNYFVSDGSLIASTQISFFTHVYANDFLNSKNVAKDLKILVENTKKNTPEYIFGNISNVFL